MMISGLVSIIMPSWNTGKYIGAAIQSVIEQTYSNWELLIVDDCSSDNTDDVVSRYTDTRIRYLKNDTNLGAALSRNYALREARGEWIAFLDSDDIWMPAKLEKQISFMTQHGYVLSYHEYEKINENGKSLGIYVSAPEFVNKKRMYRYDYIGHLTMMYSSAYFGLIQIKNISKNNDYAIRLQLYKHAGTCGYLLPDNLAKYRVREKSISHDKLIKKIKSHYDLFRHCDDQSVASALFYSFCNLFFGVLKKIRYEKTIDLRETDLSS